MHPDRLLRYSDVRNLSGCSSPIRLVGSSDALALDSGGEQKRPSVTGTVCPLLLPPVATENMRSEE